MIEVTPNMALNVAVVMAIVEVLKRASLTPWFSRIFGGKISGTVSIIVSVLVSFGTGLNGAIADGSLSLSEILSMLGIGASASGAYSLIFSKLKKVKNGN